MAEVLRGRQEIPDKFTPSFIQDKLDEDDPEYEAKKAEIWEVWTLVSSSVAELSCSLTACKRRYHQDQIPILRAGTTCFELLK